MTKRAVSILGTNPNRVRSEAAWPPHKVKTLIRLYVNDSLTCREIGRRIGATKNAVVGKKVRLGLVRGPEFVPSKAQAARLIAEELRFPPSTTLFSRLDSLDVFPGFRRCVFPIGNPGSPAFKFCGAAVPDDDVLAPFCANHQRVCWQSAKRTDNATRPIEQRRSA